MSHIRIYSIDTHSLSNQPKLMTQHASSENNPLKKPSSESYLECLEEKSSKDEFTIDKKNELLSAYLDSECSEEERYLVEHWIASNLEVKRQYQNQLKLKAAIKSVLYESTTASSLTESSTSVPPLTQKTFDQQQSLNQQSPNQQPPE